MTAVPRPICVLRCVAAYRNVAADEMPRSKWCWRTQALA